jgi:hypothetical protein
MAEKIEKTVLLMLSATLPGEITAARDALVRQARLRGKDIHDVAKMFIEWMLNPPATGEPSARDIAAWCLDQFDCGQIKEKDEREYNFVCDMSQRWGPPSEKQAKWLASIY